MRKYLPARTAIGGFGALILTLVIFFAQGGFGRMSHYTFLYIIGLAIGVGMIVFGFMKEKKVANESGTPITPSASPESKSAIETGITESLIKVQGAAKELIKLSPDANMKWSSYDYGVIVTAGDKYKAAINKLKKGVPEHKTLMDSLLKGRELLDACNRKNDMSGFKSELDENSKEIIKLTDEIISQERKPTTS